MYIYVDVFRFINKENAKRKYFNFNLHHHSFFIFIFFMKKLLLKIIFLVLLINVWLVLQVDVVDINYLIYWQVNILMIENNNDDDDIDDNDDDNE